MLRLAPAHKKSSVSGQVEVVTSACAYCNQHSQAYGEECKQDEGGMRKICLLAFSAEVSNEGGMR